MMRERFRRFLAAWRATRDLDPRLPVVAAVAVVLGAAFGYTLFGLLLPFGWISGVLFAVLFALLAGMIVFGRRAQRAQYAAIEGQAGAAYAVLAAMRGQWFIQPAVAVTRKQEMIHRAVGRCGVVLVGEGPSAGRLKQLLAQERKRHARVAGDATIHSVIVGSGAGEVSVKQLTAHLTKLPRKLSKTEVPRLEKRLRALNVDLPMPQGVAPRPSKKQR